MSAIRFTRVFLLLASCLVFACSDPEKDEQEDTLPDEIAVVVGKGGGTLKAKGVTLEIPEGALDTDTKITAKNKGKDVAVTTKATALSDVYEFGPAGTKFKADVKVSFETVQNTDKSAVFFTKENEPQVFEKLPSEKNGTTVSAKVRHFSMGFAGVEHEETGLDAGPDASLNENDAGGGKSDAGSNDAGLIDDAGVVPMTTITVESRNARNALANQTWGAFQDGDGVWKILPGPSSTGTYVFEVSNDRYAVAFVCAKPDNSSSDGNILYATTARTSLTMLASDLCSPPPAVTTYTVTGQLALPSGAFSYAYGHAYDQQVLTITGAPPTYTVYNMRAGETMDVFMAVTDVSNNYLRGLFLRDFAFSTNQTGVNLDFAKNGFVFGQGTVNVANADANFEITVEYTMRGIDEGFPIEQGMTTGTATRSRTFLTMGSMAAADRYSMRVEGLTGSNYRSFKRLSATGGTHNLTLLDLYGGTHSLETITPYARTSVSSDKYPGATSYSWSWSFEAQRGDLHRFDMQIEPAYLPAGTTYKMIFPDFSALTGYQAAWFAVAGEEALAHSVGAVVTNGSDRAVTESRTSMVVQ